MKQVGREYFAGSTHLAVPRQTRWKLVDLGAMGSREGDGLSAIKPYTLNIEPFPINPLEIGSAQIGAFPGDLRQHRMRQIGVPQIRLI